MRPLFCSILLGFASVSVAQDPLPAAGSASPIAVNQVGYLTDGPKRFTSPLLKTGAFSIQTVKGNKTVYKGAINNHLGDFSGFKPANGAGEYSINIKGQKGTSFPFSIERNLYQEQFWQPAINFMIDCRSVVGTHPSAYGGCPWRDGTYYSYEVPSLLWLYAADPVFMEGMPRQINWQEDKQRVLSPEFRYDEKNPQSEDVMEAVTRYYTELEPPADKAPDAVKLIHWGLGFYLMKPYTKDPSQDILPKQIHGQVVAQFAHFLYAWDKLKLNRWIARSFYDKCLDFVLTHWKASGGLAIDPNWSTSTYSEPIKTDSGWVLKILHPYKGRHVPGHSILPNLYMYQVTKNRFPVLARDFINAAKNQTRWIIDSLDWNIPGATKGQRGGEFKTIVNLVWFLKNMPDQAPGELQHKIEEWAQVVVSRSDNMWDFRRYDLVDHWTIPEMNETGNLAGFPACALAAASVLKEGTLKSRLTEIAYAHIDNLFGRNPKMAAAANRPHKGYPLVENGWPIHYKPDVCARLELCRGGLDASPGTEMYPYNPQGKFRHPEGWIIWNASWNVSLAFLQTSRPAHENKNGADAAYR
ncbi:cellulase N-terminal Ig-like domain-containing protein [Flaviaesturariibacter amylovorans]|uniref:Cellulase Ig-like domain-containing protein n=1 Tax=Flaviaesturariibacter amylovorans TaxID=1084520 RepID=A0ABP8HSE6_9BACT